MFCFSGGGRATDPPVTRLCMTKSHYDPANEPGWGTTKGIKKGGEALLHPLLLSTLKASHGTNHQQGNSTNSMSSKSMDKQRPRMSVP